MNVDNEITNMVNLIALKSQIDAIKEALNTEQKEVYNASMKSKMEDFISSDFYQSIPTQKQNEVSDLFSKTLL